ncbi:MAG: serine/threonine-protein kinase [Solirubrobacterales bacterium]
MTDLSPGAEFAGHRIEAEVKRGGMGVVYRATDLRLKRPVALKVIAPELAREADFRARFERESRMAAAIDHPNVIPIYHSGEQDGVLFTTMLWVEGHDLGDLIAQEGRLSLAVAADIVSQAAAGLDAAHARGLIHRDVKPGNIMVRSDGRGGYHAYLSDFGLTKRVDGRTALTMSGMFVGTVDYVAPEQLMGTEVDGRADVYSLGCVLFHALVGLAPYREQSDWMTLKAHEAGEIPSVCAQRPDLPEQIDEVIACALAKSPADRYPTAGDLGRAVLAVAEGKPAAVVPDRNGTEDATKTEDATEAMETKLAGRPEETRLTDTGETKLAERSQLAGRSWLQEQPRSLLAVAGAVVGLALIAVVLVVAGVFGGGQSQSSSRNSGSPGNATPAPAAGPTVVLGSTASMPSPSCPGQPCQAVGRATGFQIADGETKLPFIAPTSGTIAAWTLTLSQPTSQQRGFFNNFFGSPPEARLAILRGIPGSTPPRYSLVSQGPIQVLSGYLGRTAEFSASLEVREGDVVALTVPTWAPAFSRGISADNGWRASRLPGGCWNSSDVRQGRPQMVVGQSATYGCRYTTSRLLYTASLVEGG